MHKLTSIQVKEKLQSKIEKVTEEIVKNENYLVNTPDLGLKKILEVCNRQMELGRCIEYMSNICKMAVLREQHEAMQDKKIISLEKN